MPVFEQDRSDVNSASLALDNHKCHHYISFLHIMYRFRYNTVLRHEAKQQAVRSNRDVL